MRYSAVVDPPLMTMNMRSAPDKAREASVVLACDADDGNIAIVQDGVQGAGSDRFVIVLDGDDARVIVLLELARTVMVTSSSKLKAKRASS